MDIAVDSSRLGAATARAYPGSTLLRSWHLEGGMSTHMTALELLLPVGETHKIILRKPGEWAIERNAAAAADEFKFLKIAHSAGLKVPEPYFLDVSGEIIPEPYLLIEFVEEATDWAPVDVSGSVTEMAVELARIHTLGGAIPDLAFLPVHENRIALAFAHQLASHVIAADAELSHFLRTVEPSFPLNDPTLLHGDFWPGNVIWKDGRLAAVIDWEEPELGDPLADLAISRLDLLFLFGRDGMDQFTARYRSLMNVDFRNLPYWDIGAALRALPNVADWSKGYPGHGRPDVTAQSMKEAAEWFLYQAREDL